MIGKLVYLNHVIIVCFPERIIVSLKTEAGKQIVSYWKLILNLLNVNPSATSKRRAKCEMLLNYEVVQKAWTYMLMENEHEILRPH